MSRPERDGRFRVRTSEAVVDSLDLEPLRCTDVDVLGEVGGGVDAAAGEDGGAESGVLRR